MSMCFLPKALLQGTQSLLGAMQVIAGPVLIEDTIKTNKSTFFFPTTQRVH